MLIKIMGASKKFGLKSLVDNKKIEECTYDTITFYENGLLLTAVKDGIAKTFRTSDCKLGIPWEKEGMKFEG
jgi:hypothetical protein